MGEVSNTPFSPVTYGCKVGRVWVQIDFKAQAVYVYTSERGRRSTRTEEIGGPTTGVLVDWDRDELIGVEILG